jgi:hypothetical protein
MWSNGQLEEHKFHIYKRPDDVRYCQPGAKEAVPNVSVKLMQKIKNTKFYILLTVHHVMILGK